MFGAAEGDNESQWGLLLSQADDGAPGPCVPSLSRLLLFPDDSACRNLPSNTIQNNMQSEGEPLAAAAPAVHAPVHAVAADAVDAAVAAAVVADAAVAVVVAAAVVIVAAAVVVAAVVVADAVIAVVAVAAAVAAATAAAASDAMVLPARVCCNFRMCCLHQ